MTDEKKQKTLKITAILLVAITVLTVGIIGIYSPDCCLEFDGGKQIC